METEVTVVIYLKLLYNWFIMRYIQQAGIEAIMEGRCGRTV